MELEAFELVILRRPPDAHEYDEATLERIQRARLAFRERLREVMTWWCRPGTMTRPGRRIAVPDP